MSKPEIVLFEICIYKKCPIAYLKVCSWIGSWIGGILPLRKYDIGALSCAYFLFSLTLLIEIVLERKENICFESKIIYVLYCFFPASLLLMSFASMSANAYFINPEIHSLLMFIFSIVILVILLFNLVLSNVLPRKSTRKTDKISELKIDQEKMFNNNLHVGKLGSLKEGDKNE